jgi:hypothetical protein
MYCHSRCACCFRRLCHLNSLHFVCTKSFAKFHRHRFVNRFYRFLDNFCRKRNVFKESRTLAIIYNLWHRTPHIDI